MSSDRECKGEDRNIIYHAHMYQVGFRASDGILGYYCVAVLCKEQ